MATKKKKATKNKLINAEPKLISLDNLQQFYDELVPLPIKNGGTGATTVPDARNNLGLGKTSGPVPIANGGTGASNVNDAITNLGLKGAETYKLLWTNSSPSSNFEPQTISLDLTSYKSVLVVGNFDANHLSSTWTSRCLIGEGSETIYPSAGESGSVQQTTTARNYVPSNSGVAFGNGVVWHSGSAGWTVYNLNAIPMRIYGIKEV